MMIDGINKILESNEIMVRIGPTWYNLESIDCVDGVMPILVSDNDGEDHEFDMADIEEFDNSEIMEPIFMLTNSNIVGIA